MAKLNTFVNVDGTWYGPNDTLPDEVAAQINNPKVWAEAPSGPDATAEPAPVKEPPRGGPGSSADAWRAFMTAQGLEVPDGATAKDMQAAWDDRDKR